MDPNMLCYDFNIQTDHPDMGGPTVVPGYSRAYPAHGGIHMYSIVVHGGIYMYSIVKVSKL